MLIKNIIDGMSINEIIANTSSKIMVMSTNIGLIKMAEATKEVFSTGK